MSEPQQKSYTAVLIGPESVRDINGPELVFVHVAAVDMSVAYEAAQEKAAAHRAARDGGPFEPHQFEPHLLLEGHVRVAEFDPYSLTVTRIGAPELEGKLCPAPAEVPVLTLAERLARGESLSPSRGEQVRNRELEPER